MRKVGCRSEDSLMIVYIWTIHEDRVQILVLKRDGEEEGGGEEKREEEGRERS